MADLQQRYDSLLEAVEHLRAENEKLKKANQLLWAEKVQWQHDKLNQQVIIQQALSNANATNNRYLEENQKLKERVKALGG